mmetsp:Transcript_63799/g.132867  ORF Transcript_63799/g.132867 Transcript_63799/m.132867 type:complete len:495 (+) Transcript_63799:153-1637(+)|eukprot:CAMPEP_0181324186 /NCGR_PEP_ID=MMETSP1101-20121128/20215_1 /TAXON_ID=46948 /ORGANISM="Rhodomonas abbreviata, Strain Caron Lab Isolate" /LENGTH=494 /DNA_ID=CAMNT_0023432325 /DNA_START=152 /DNA_END=1633 /DNA_ORIENTATION=+
MPASTDGQPHPAGPVKVLSVEEQVLLNTKRTHEMFASNYGARLQELEGPKKLRVGIKTRDEYAVVKDLPPPTAPSAALAKAPSAGKQAKPLVPLMTAAEDSDAKAHLKAQAVSKVHQDETAASAPVEGDKPGGKAAAGGLQMALYKPAGSSQALTVRAGRGPTMPKPEWHAPWKLMRVISGHLGWVRCICVEPGNEWFCTGAGDRTLKLWDLASGDLKLTLTGHISPVRGIAISDRHPYMFTVGEDKLVKCWDLETNKVIRHYHGHLSGVYCCSLHPTLDVLCTGGRDSSVRVWDIRGKSQIFCLAGHKDTVGSLCTQSTDPQIISGSHDSTIRLWDLAAGNSYATLTHHKKSVRSVVLHPSKYLFASASADNVKQWKCPEGQFMKNVECPRAIINCLAVNHDDVFVSGQDNGTLQFFDWKTGYNFHTEQTRVQPGSLESEAGIYAMTLDKTGTRLLTCEADKTIKIWKEDENATPQTHPVNWKAAAPGTEKRW